MKSSVQRLNNIKGQIEGVRRMIEEGGDCIEIMTQLKAIKSAVSGVMSLVMETEIESCMEGLNNKEKKLLIKLKNYVKTN